MKRLAILVGLLLIVVACGGNGDGGNGDGGNGGEELTLAEYFQLIEAATDESVQRTDELQQTFEAAGANASSPADLIAPALVFFNGTSEVLSDFIATFRAIDPPGAVADAHDAAVVALDDLTTAFEDAVSGGIESVADLEVLFENAAMDEASERVDETCSELQAAAAANDIDVDLEC